MRSAHLLLVALAAVSALSCGTPGAPMPPSLQLPQPVSDLTAARKGDRVLLQWTVPRETNDKATVKRLGTTRICRAVAETTMSQCGTPVGTVQAAQVSPGSKASFTDLLSKQVEEDNPTGFATYAVETTNDRGRSAGLGNQVRVMLAPTLAPPADFRAQVTADGPVLTWTGELHSHESPDLGHRFRVYRRTEGVPGETLLGEVRLRNQPEVVMPDRSFDWEKTYEYRLTVVTSVTQNGEVIAEVEGEDSPPVKVLVHDSFPPTIPSGLQAVYSGLEQQRFIDLTWAPDTEADLAGYNVYRHEGGGAPVKINSELVKTPSFRDANVQAGHTYDYAVSAVDLRNNESARSEEAHETVPQ